MEGRTRCSVRLVKEGRDGGDRWFFSKRIGVEEENERREEKRWEEKKKQCIKDMNNNMNGIYK